MATYIEITITAQVPDDKEDLGYEAVVETKAGVHDLLQQLHKLGLTDGTQARRIIRRKATGTKAAPAPTEV